MRSVSGSLTSFSVAGLTPFTNYSFEVSAFTDSNRFEGNRSDVKIFETSESSKTSIGFHVSINQDFDFIAPTVPLSFSVNSITAKTATFTWAEPATANGIIIGYTLRIEDQTPPGASITNVLLGPNDHSYVATNLSEYTDYIAYVSARTSAGRGDEAQTSLFTTLQAGTNCLCIRARERLYFLSVFSSSQQRTHSSAVDGNVGYYNSQLESSFDRRRQRSSGWIPDLSSRKRDWCCDCEQNTASKQYDIYSVRTEGIHLLRIRGCCRIGWRRWACYDSRSPNG